MTGLQEGAVHVIRGFTMTDSNARAVGRSSDQTRIGSRARRLTRMPGYDKYLLLSLLL